MRPGEQYVAFGGRLVMLGFGSIGTAVLPLLLRHAGVTASRVKIIAPDSQDEVLAAELGIEYRIEELTEKNYESVLAPLVSEGDFLLNLSIGVASTALIGFCARHGVLYLDTCIEPWGSLCTDPRVPLERRSNYALREEILTMRRHLRNTPTALVTQGANPGLISSFTKKALENVAVDCGIDLAGPRGEDFWPRLAQRLGVRAIHIAERDTQIGDGPKRRDEFVNTWSVDGFVEEGLQPAELGWGTHERHWPADAERHPHGCGAAIYLRRPGLATRVRSWTPLQGSYHGFLVTHGESISIADHLSVRENGEVVYRPTVHYAYHPCDDAVLSIHECAGRNWRLQSRSRIMRDEITEGMDELGVLLMGMPQARGVYWFGSRLTIQQARDLAPENSATSLQVIAGILGGFVWCLRNPRAGIVEPDDIDHETVLEVARPYLGELVGAYGDWTPLKDRTPLYDEPKDERDPWQFVNIRVG